MSALDIQVGGDHYKKYKVQPMEYSMANGLDACQHTAIKYITRFRDKGGIADLEKAKHCIDLLIEFERKAEDSPNPRYAPGNPAIPSESEATHRDGVGNKFKQQKTTGRWEHWKNGEWMFPSEDPQWVPDGLRTVTWPGEQDWIIHVGRVAPWPEQHYQNIELEINNGPTSRYSFGTVQTLKSWESDRESPHRITRYRWIE